MQRPARGFLAAGLIAIAAAFVWLGFWQLRRLQERRAANAAALARRDAPPVHLTFPRTITDSALAERRVNLIGRYDHTHELVLRGQAYQGIPGVLVVTPLLLERTDTAVLVLRGFVPAPDATTPPALDSLEERGQVTVRGIALPIGSAPDRGRPLTHAGRTSWARLDLAALRDTLPYPVLGAYLRQSPDPALPKLPRRLEPPPLDDGPHRNYAIQWFAFAAMAVVFAGVVMKAGSAHR